MVINGYNPLTNLLLTSWDIQVVVATSKPFAEMLCWVRIIYLEPETSISRNGCFNGTIPNLYIGNGVAKHPFYIGCLGYLVSFLTPTVL